MSQTLKVARFDPGVNGQLFPAVVEQPHGARVPSSPQPTANEFWWRLDVAVAADRTAGFLKRRKAIAWQRQQCGAFGCLKPLADLLLGFAVDPCAGDVRFPIEQEFVLFT